MNKMWGRQTIKPGPTRSKWMKKKLCGKSKFCLTNNPRVSTTRHFWRRMKKSDFNFWLTRENYFSIYKFRLHSHLPYTCVPSFVLPSPWQTNFTTWRFYVLKTFVEFFSPQSSKALTTQKNVLDVTKSGIKMQSQSFQTASHNIFVLIPQKSRKSLLNNWKSEEKIDSPNQMKAIDNTEKFVVFLSRRRRGRRLGRKTLLLDFRGNSLSVYNAEVMIGIMSAIVVDAIGAEWFHFVMASTFIRTALVNGRKLIQLLELCPNELCFCLGFAGSGEMQKVESKNNAQCSHRNDWEKCLLEIGKGASSSSDQQTYFKTGRNDGEQKIVFCHKS